MTKPEQTRAFPPDPAGPFKYDIAFSFLSTDLEKAHALEAHLAPALSVFIYDRKGDELLAADGMERFSTVFRYEARLNVLLYRDGYGRTAWTAFEEAHIKDRALHSRFTSLAFVNLDGSTPPTWIPMHYLYAGEKGDDLTALSAVLRYRAREVGAKPHRPSPAETAAALARVNARHNERDARLQSETAPAFAYAEVQRLLATVQRLLADAVAQTPTLNVRCELAENGTMLYLVSPRLSTTVWWHLEYSNSLSRSHLDVNEINVRVGLPSEQAYHRIGKPPTLKTKSFEFYLSDELEPQWRYFTASAKRKATTSEALADEIVQSHIRRYYDGLEKARPDPWPT